MNRSPFIKTLRAGIGFAMAVLGAGQSLQAAVEASESLPMPVSDLQSYLAQAMAANPQLKAFSRRYDAATQRVPQVSALPDPMFQVTHFVESVQTRTGPQENVFTFSQKIPWFGKLSSRESAASAEAQALWFAYQNQQLTLARSVSVAFYEYGYIEEAIRLTQENVELLSKLEPIIEEKIRAGGDINALLRLKVEIGKVDDRLQSLQQQRVSQSARLRELLALPGEEVLPWPQWEAPDIITPDGPSLAVAMEANNPGLQMLERKITSAEARREIARLESYPDITLGFNYIQTGDPVVNPNTPDAGQDPWGFTVAVNIPIWFGKYDAAKAEALANQRSFESEYDNQLNTLRTQLTVSLSGLADANRRLQLYGEDLLGLAEQAAENSRSGYETGQLGILDLIDSERSLLDLQLLYWRAASDAWQQRVNIQALANLPILGTFHVTQNDE
ncbi:TolC family protein [Ruficoccus sp. ZRK36]|uniref:TolC family protein n=1 Tax=Ruficoccus sp. ZRK36 TaxID=2866311 RepID=UPI001C73A5A2|nr:TolC family protein [Ruficoccus sp. ZRK36]QYY35390.1 TolC family protein [Ruficoccus sp. ZRK36]